MALTRRDIAIAAVGLFIAWGFLTHWAPVLRYLGYAFLTGVVSSALAISTLILLSTRSKQNVLDNAVRTPQTAAFVAPEAWKAEVEWLSRDTDYKSEPLFPSSFVVSESIDNLLDLAIRDFISPWYKSITPNLNFANEIDKAVRIALVNTRKRVESQDLAEVVVSRFVPISTAHLKDFYEAEHAVRGKKLNRNVTESEELDLAIAAKYKDGKLHPAVSLAYSDTKLVQQDYLRKLVVRIMPLVLPRSMLQSRAVAVLLKEIVSCAILAPVMQILSDPDTWNQLVEAYVRALEWHS